jgi:hypothetical protein
LRLLQNRFFLSLMLRLPTSLQSALSPLILPPF